MRLLVCPGTPQEAKACDQGVVHALAGRLHRVVEKVLGKNGSHSAASRHARSLGGGSPTVNALNGNGLAARIASGPGRAYNRAQSKQRTWGRSGSTGVKKRTSRAGGLPNLVKKGRTALTAEDNYALAA